MATSPEEFVVEIELKVKIGDQVIQTNRSAIIPIIYEKRPEPKCSVDPNCEGVDAIHIVDHQKPRATWTNREP